MKMTVRFTDVYDGHEYPRTEVLDVTEPPAAGDDLDDWAYDAIYPSTGTANFTHESSGYFAKITECDQRPDLVGHEFEWGI